MTACARAGSDAPPGACPPIVEYSRAEQARLADEVAALPEGAALIRWLADYAVLRDQVGACAHPRGPTGSFRSGSGTARGLTRAGDFAEGRAGAWAQLSRAI